MASDPGTGHGGPEDGQERPLGPMSELGVGLDCLDCWFQTESEQKADVHYALTGHRIAIDYIDHESEWPTIGSPDA